MDHQLMTKILKNLKKGTMMLCIASLARNGNAKFALMLPILSLSMTFTDQNSAWWDFTDEVHATMENVLLQE